MTKVYSCKILPENDFLKLKGDLLHKIPASSVEKVLKFKKAINLQHSLLGILMITKLVKEKFSLEPNEITFNISEKGKPYIPGLNFHFNISHSGQWVVVSISSTETGIDVEQIKKPNLKLATRYFSEEEKQWLFSKTLKGQEKYFYTLWTLKESYLKLLGKGLTKSLSSFTIIDTDLEFKLKDNDTGINQVFFKQYFLDIGHELSVCSFSSVFADEINHISISELQYG